ncbi:S41 family peptidase [Mucilaginibacter terrae]|uniref:Carboxyl-terminal processing protease n=1 Tax=Mucilaginibacter terrae TaxID=1955052 RepID=A0ABU3GPE1_9SPHI|nr:S41 family peptidase [Mucilaginibacter terrae]MDT3401637.1 carboxyl-terminal processing protease [Mucilaginibacter terrae]
MKRTLYFLLLLCIAFASCKKGSKTNDQEPTPEEKAEALRLVKDSIYLYAQELYLWYDALPSAAVFNPTQYTGSSFINAFQAEIDAFSQLKINPSTNQPYEYDASYPGTAKYSYIDEGQAATSIGGTGGDFGFALTYITSSDLRIRYVYPGSSAATQNIARGYKVTAINDASVALTTGGNNDPAYIRISNALGENSIKLTLLRPDGTTFTTTVSKTTYTINPVIKYSTITSSTGKKVGYFAFSRFTTLSNAQAKIDEAFAKFATDNITELVVDLRYNGGGAVETSQYLANYMVPASKNGTTMFTEYFNDKLQRDVYPLLARKYRIDKGDFSTATNTYKFSKKGSLNLNRVFFLVTGNTASASELLINNLQPTLPQGVQLIGKTTYGKPVGFFGIPVGNASQYDLYISEFESRNGAGKADFYQGMVPASANYPGAVVDDDVTKDFGDPNEAMLVRALNFIDKGTYTVTGLASTFSEKTQENQMLRQANQLIDLKQQFSGAVHSGNLKRLNK